MLHRFGIASTVLVTLLACLLASWGEARAGAEPGEDLLQFLSCPESQARLDALTRSRESRNRVTLLHLGQASNPVRLQLLREARDFVYLDVPYWYGDTEGLRTFDALKERRQAVPSLDLRVMIDWSTPASSNDAFKTGIFRKLDKLAKGNLQEWNSPSWGKSWSGSLLKNHMHDKLFIVDGTRLIMGGMNMQNTYLQGGLTREGWHDTDILVEGPAAVEATKIFLKTWELARYLEKPLRYSVPPKPRQLAGLLQELYYEDRLELPFSVFGEGDERAIRLPLQERFAELARLAEGLRVPEDAVPLRLIYDNPLVDRDRRTGKAFSKTRDTLGFLFAHARERIRIFMPYLTLTPAFERMVVEAARRVPVEIITNSMQSNDLGKYPYYAAVSHHSALLDAGVRIYEWQGHTPLKALEKAQDCTIPVGQWPGDTLHTKVVVIDGAVSLVGSHNLNTRSEGYNTEIMALVLDRALASQLEAVFETDLDSAAEARTVTCGSAEYPRARRVEPVTRERLRAFLKKHGKAVRFYSRLQFAM